MINLSTFTITILKFILIGSVIFLKSPYIIIKIFFKHTSPLYNNCNLFLPLYL